MSDVYPDFGVVDGDIQLYLRSNLNEPAARIVLDRLQPDLIRDYSPAKIKFQSFILTSHILGIDLRELKRIRLLSHIAMDFCDGVPSVKNGIIDASFTTDNLRGEFVYQSVQSFFDANIQRFHETDVDNTIMTPKIQFTENPPLTKFWKGKLFAIVLARFKFPVV